MCLNLHTVLLTLLSLLSTQFSYVVILEVEISSTRPFSNFLVPRSLTYEGTSDNKLDLRVCIGIGSLYRVL